MSLVTLVAVCAVSMSQTVAQDVQRVPAFRTVVKVLRETEIPMEVAGTLKTVVPTEEGIFVRKGDLLAAVNDEVIKAEVAAADFEAEMVKVEIEFARIALENAELDLKAKLDANRESADAYSPSEIRQVQLEVEKSKASLSKSQKDQQAKELAAQVKHAELKRYSAFAPHDGCITDIRMFPGQSPRQGDPVLTLTDLSVLEAEVQVPFQYRDLLHVGDEVEFRQNSGVRAALAPRETQRAADRPVADEDSLFRPSEPAKDEPVFGKSDDDEAPSISPGDSGSDEIFSGRIKFIKPRLVKEQNQAYVVLSVHVTNPRDGEGRYRLQEGMELDAVVLSTPPGKAALLQR
ncbi:MAG: efflux RND transporter periplasmic adaptor subunit [Planctomycetota bacterium]